MLILTRLTILALFSVLFLTNCAKLPDNSGRSTSFAVRDIQETRLGKAATPYFDSDSGESAYLMLGNGLDAFVARAALAQGADLSIDAQYYLLHNDEAGVLFIDQLLKAADRGVRVRLLIDDMDLEGRDFGITVLDAHQNVEVRIFNPFGRNTNRTIQFISGFGEQTRRSHNKSFTVDSAATILGGRNIGNEYFIADPDFAFLDLDVLAAGPVATMVAGSFDLYWNHELSYPISSLMDEVPTPEQIKERMDKFNTFVADQEDSLFVENLRESRLATYLGTLDAELIAGKGYVFADHPDKLTDDIDDTSNFMLADLLPYLESASKELIVISPYFVPGNNGVAFFTRLREKGVRVVVFTNSLSSTDVSVVHAGYANYRERLLRAGVEIYELNKDLLKTRTDHKGGKFYQSKASLHAKSFVIDRKNIFIGSLNLDPRSVRQNTEIGLLIESEELAQQLASFIDNEIDNLAFRLELKSGYGYQDYIVWHGVIDGKQTSLITEPYTGFWQRFMVGLMRLLPIESQI